MGRPKTFNHEIRQKLCFAYAATIRRHFGVEPRIETPPLEFVASPPGPVDTIHGKAQTGFTCSPSFLHVYFQFVDRVPAPSDLPVGLATLNPHSGKWNSWTEPREDPLASGLEVVEDFERRMEAISASAHIEVRLTRRQGERLRDALAEVTFRQADHLGEHAEAFRDLFTLVSEKLL